MKPFRSSRRSSDLRPIAGNGSFGRDGRKVFGAQDESANTIEHLLRRLTVAVDEIKPLMSALRSDGWKSCMKVTKRLSMFNGQLLSKISVLRITFPLKPFFDFSMGCRCRVASLLAEAAQHIVKLTI